MKSLDGIVTVLNTPFTDDDRIDLDALARHVEYAIGCGVTGFLVPALASEVYKLSQSERLDVVKTTLETSAGRVPVIGGATAADETERLNAARQLTELGCEGILVSVPYHNNDVDYQQQIKRVAHNAPGFLMIQDWDVSGDGLPIPLILRMFDEIEELQSIKIEVVPAGVKYTRILEATQGRLHVAGGWAVTQMIEALDRGVHTLMPTGLHAIYTTIFKLYQENERDEAIRQFRKLLPILAFSNQHLDISIHFFKRFLYQQGIYPTANVRQPILSFDDYHIRIADELIGYALNLIESLEQTGTRNE